MNIVPFDDERVLSRVWFSRLGELDGCPIENPSDPQTLPIWGVLVGCADENARSRDRDKPAVHRADGRVPFDECGDEGADGDGNGMGRSLHSSTIAGLLWICGECDNRGRIK